MRRFVLIINGLVLKNCSFPAQVRNFVSIFYLNHGFRGFHRFYRKLYTARANKIVHFFVDNQWFGAEKLYTPEESGHSVPVQVYNFDLTPALSNGEGGINHIFLKIAHFAEK